MAGIEQAFENFVKRVSSQEEPQSEYGEPQTGDKRIPIYQNINPGYDVYESMPTRGGNSFQQDLAYGGVASMFPERSGYADGRIVNKKEPLYSVDPLGYTRNINESPTLDINPMEKDLETIGGIAGVEGIGQLMAKKGLEEAASSATATAKDITKYLNDKMKTAKGSRDVLNDISMKEILEDSIGGAATHKQMKDFIKNYFKDYFKDASLNKKFADGGRVSMSEGGLTKTVPPAKGPDSQGVESLFRRRYS